MTFQADRGDADKLGAAIAQAARRWTRASANDYQSADRQDRRARALYRRRLSGALQHRPHEDAKVIVAINKDEELRSPVADYSLVADLFQAFAGTCTEPKEDFRLQPNFRGRYDHYGTHRPFRRSSSGVRCVHTGIRTGIVGGADGTASLSSRWPLLDVALNDVSQERLKRRSPRSTVIWRG